MTFFDSFGLDVLARATRLAATADVELLVERPSAPCRRVLERAPLGAMLTIVDEM